MSNQLLVICLDGGDARVVRQLTEEGRMPALAALLERGAAVELDTLAHLMPDSVWAPLLSGQPPGAYASAHFAEFVPETMGLRFVREAPSDLEPFWLYLPARGEGVLVLDAPEFHPHPESLAAEACCWHQVAPPHEPVFTSAELERTLRAFGRPPVLTDVERRPSREEERRASGHFADSARFRSRAAQAAIDRHALAVIGFHELHAAGHWLWHHWDDRHWHRPADPEPELLTRPYKALDAALEPLIARSDGANVAVVLARGARAANGGPNLLQELLLRAGLLARRGVELGGRGPQGERSGLTETARRLLPRAARERLARLLPDETQRRLASRRFRDHYDWERTLVFPCPAWTTGFLRANVIGREAAGVVEPSEADALLERTTKLLHELRDADTGEPLVREVIRAADVFPGPRAHHLPDLFVDWEGDRPASGATHPELGEWRAEPSNPHLWSEHGRRGLVLLAGPDVRRLDRPIEGDQLSLAPTLLALAGVRRTALGSPWDDVLAP